MKFKVIESMANIKLSSHDFIQNSFCPLIATFCSPKVEQTCRKNNLSFTELVQPFCTITSEGHIQDSNGSSITVKNLRLNLIDVHSQPPQPTKARKLLNESVSLLSNERLTTCEIGNLLLEVPSVFPWFESWRETFLQVQFPSDHEFLKHYLACILVVSSKESNPAETLARMEDDLGKMQNLAPNTLPKWFCPTNILRYYVVLHDNLDADLKVSESVLEGMSTTYGTKNCFLLRINSQSPMSVDNELTDPWSQYINKNISTQDNMNDLDLDNHHISTSTGSLETGQEADESPVILHPLSPVSETQNIISNSNSYEKGLTDSGVNNNIPRVQHGACLTTSDLDQIRQMIDEFCINALLPHIEVHIAQLSFIISNKKGVSRSLLSATKRWFGTNKPGTQTNALPPTSVMYSTDSPEIQQRRLGDLYFMLHAYPQAYTAYHSAKRDFHADSAWLHYAGALEMAAISLFMQPGDTVRKAHDYADDSIMTYLNSCRMPQFATRATLFSVECLRSRGLHGEAAKQLIRMTCEDSDLRSALLLEQAAHCFLAASRPIMPRKYAFHLVLAGHRYSKAGQKRHSLRCYRQAHQVYEGKNWSLAEDHIHFTIGRMAAGLKRGQEATEAFARLLPRASRQGAAQQASFLKEYLLTQQEVSIETGEIPVLPLPVIDGSSIQVLLDSQQRGSNTDAISASGLSFQLSKEENTRWCKLEEQAVNVAFEGQAFVFKPTIELLNNTTNNVNPATAYINEEISVSVNMENPLHISLPLKNVRLLWSLIPVDGGLCQDNQPGVAVPAQTQLAASSDALDVLTIEPDSTKNVILRLTPKRTGELKITGLGYSLNSEGAGAVTGKQHLVVPPRPRLRASKDHRALESVVDNRLTLQVIDSLPQLRVTFQGLRSELVCGELYTVKVELMNSGSRPISRVLVASSTPHLVSIGQKSANGVCSVPLPKPLAPGQSSSMQMLLCAPETKGSSKLHLLFYYESSPQERGRPRYRLVRHSWPLSVHESLHISALATRSCSSSHESETLNIRLSVENNNQIHDPLLIQVSLQKVSLFSEKWRMCPNAHCPKEPTLEAQETIHLMLQANAEISGSGRPELSSVVLDAESSSSPCIDFIGRRPDEESSGSPDDDLSLRSTLVVMWKGSITENGGCKRIVIGQHHIRLSKLDETVSCPADNSSAAQETAAVSDAVHLFGAPEEALQSQLFKQRLLTFNLFHPPSVCHDFKLNRVCIVPVKVEARNCCDNSLAVKFEAKGPGTVASSHKSQLYSPRPASSFHWVGQTVATVQLERRSRYELALAVVLTAPGAYDLGAHLTVSVSLSETSSEFVPQIWRPEAILVVKT